MNIEQLRNLCLQMPAATEEIKWGSDLVFAVGGKMFCIAATEGSFVFSLKVPPDTFDEWCAQPGIIPAPYLAKAGWVQFQQPEKLAANQAAALVANSYQLVALKLSKRQKAALGL